MSQIGCAHAGCMRTLTQQLDRRSCKTALRGVAGTLHSSLPHVPRGCPAVLSSRFSHSRPALARPRRCLPTRTSFLLESGTSAYFLGTYDRPRVVLFCLAAWAGSAGRRLRGHLHSPITLLPPPSPVLSLPQLRAVSFAFEFSRDYFPSASIKI